ncbi:MAG: class I SAM-dependent methyltransferase [Bacteroidales bacterium]|nr:class I SAM-dependent methyltransferase [Bacteroidales bacterium]
MSYSSMVIKLKKILSQKGPHSEEFKDIIKIFEDLSKEDDIEQFRDMLEPILKSDTLMGHSFIKPLGYSGDYQIIEKMYTSHKSLNPELFKWDEFFHWLPAVSAVVNRKGMAVSLLKSLNRKTQKARTKVLILGSGPATEVNEYFESVTDNKIYFDLVDFDQRAIEHAEAKNYKYMDYITFHNKNVLRFSPEGSYDLIWSAGLFDYFQDKLFVRLLRRFSCSLNDQGEMIIGNFNTSNPSRKIMEVLGDWYLYHRTEEQLINFAIEAGIPPENIEIFSEPLKINLFLKVKKSDNAANVPKDL